MDALEFIDYFIKYGFPIGALFLSIFSYKDSRNANKVQERVSVIEEQLLCYELEDKEKERVQAMKAKVKARIINISKKNYKMKIWNAGKATAYNVDFIIPEECKGIVYRNKVPYKFLESEQSFEEIVSVYMGSPRDFIVTTTWKDEEGTSFSKEQMVSI